MHAHHEPLTAFPTGLQTAHKRRSDQHDDTDHQTAISANTATANTATTNKEPSINTTSRPAGHDASANARRRRGRWITAGAALATTSLVATLFPARVEAVAPDLPPIVAEPSAWGLPALPGSGENNSLLDLERAGDVCQIGDDDMCVVRTTTPAFGPGDVEPHPELGWEYVLYDLGAEQARGDVSGPTTSDRWTPAAGSMVDGGTYVVAVSPADDGSTPPPEDPVDEDDPADEEEPAEDPTQAMLVIVDQTGDALQEWQHAGPFAMAPTTGELILDAPLGTSDVSVPLSLTYRTSNLTTPAVGPFRAPLGGGWELTLPAPPTWFEVIEYGATGTLELVGTNGQRLRYLDNGDGTYDLPQLVDTDVAGVRAILTADESTGGWRLVDTDGAVYEFSYWGDLERYTAPLSDDVGAATYETTWFDGTLTSVTDPVTGRSVELGYVGGPTGCPATPGGFDAAPLGGLCSITFIDDPAGDATTRIDVGWQGDDISALFLPEGRRLDMAYDNAGVMTTLRDPRAGLVDAVAGESADTNYDLTYDSNGRIATITSPAATPGSSAREVLTFGYGADNATVTSVFDGSAPQVTTITFDPDTWVTNSVTDPLGVTAVALYDADDRPVGLREGQLQTVYERADDGRAVTIWGPAPVSMFDSATHMPLAAHRDSMPMSQELIDSTTDSQGWVATWWNSTTRNAATVANTVVSGPITAAPGISGGWSAELVTTVDRDDAAAGYAVTVDGATLEEVTVDGEEVDSTGLPVLPDAEPGEGPVLISVLVSGENAPGAGNPVTVAVTAVDAA
ncbi:MAG: hypothetical protein AAFY28_16725, partial [Actinomycetota bacterium]